MVRNQFSMKHLRHWIPILGIIALIALFLKMPEAASFFSCKHCSPSDPYLPLIGASYFATLMAISLLFPSFPSPQIARGGLTWATLLALALTYLNWPTLCLVCLISHACNILIWAIWVFVPSPIEDLQTSSIRERVYLALLAPVSIVALFSCLNLTFMAYGFKINHLELTNGLQAGDEMPTFMTQTTQGLSITHADVAQTLGIVLNFVAPNCPFCKEHLPIFNSVAMQLTHQSYRFINVSPVLLPELVQQSPTAEWIEDKEEVLRKLFKVSGYPTMFVVGTNGKITQVIPGVPEQLKNDLLTSMIPSKSN
jgi:thiol-disulfide isomerase/thioredoxin